MTWHYSRDKARAGGSYTTTDELDPADDDDFDDVVYYSDPGRWRWVAALAGAVLVLAIIGTIVILHGGDSASTSARIVPSTSAPMVASPVPSRPPPAATSSTSLSPETVTTVTPSATTPTTEAPPPASEPNPHTITYAISGTRQPGDIVTVTYIDENGAPRTDFNVTLPWTRTVTPVGTMLVKSVTAVSLASHLNCSITDANRQTITSQDYDTIATTCNR